MTDYDDYMGALHDLEYSISVATNYKQKQSLLRVMDIFKKLRPDYSEDEEELE